MSDLLIILLSLLTVSYAATNNKPPFLLVSVDDPTTESDVPAVEPVPEGCEHSVTTVNGKPVCRAQLIFKDDFEFINRNKWTFDVRIPTTPDYEFVAYVKRRENSWTEGGILHLRPTVLTGTTEIGGGKLKLENCSREEHGGSCYRASKSFLVLPPVLAPRMRTKNSFSFRYGEVKIRAKLPKGDWIYPMVWLEPKDSEYGRWYISGRMIMARSRGNDDFGVPGGSLNYGNRAVYQGCMYWPNNTGKIEPHFIPSTKNNDSWSKDFHTFTMRWTPENVTFQIDGTRKTTCRLPNKTFLEKNTPWRRFGPLAPFDKEFYLTLGVAVGGVREFPDSWVGLNNKTKPWKNTGAKALLNFWQAKDDWFSTWTPRAATELQVESIEVYAL